VSLASVFVAFFACHHVGDYLLQTEWQANNKARGLARGAGVARRALLAHGSVYTLSFVPALVWIATESDAAVAVLAGALVFVPHIVVDDARLLRAYVRDVKGVGEPLDDALLTAVDQSVHLVSLFAVAAFASALG
jgi:hypothetical protein